MLSAHKLTLMFGFISLAFPVLAAAQEQAGTAGGNSDARFSVVYIGPSGSKDFNRRIINPMQAAADDLNIDLEIFLAGKGRAAIIDRAKALAKRSKKPDYVLLSNLNNLAARALLPLGGAGIPAITIISDLNEADQQTLDRLALPFRLPLGSVSGDYKEAGYDMARFVQAHYDRRFRSNPQTGILALPGDLRTPENVQLREGLKLAIAGSENRLFLRASVPVQWSGIRARKLVKEFARKDETLAVWSGTSVIAEGAMLGFQDAGEQSGNKNLIVTLGWNQKMVAAVSNNHVGLALGGTPLAGAFALVMLRDYQDGLDFANQDITVSPDDQLFADDPHDTLANFRGALRYDMPQLTQKNVKNFQKVFLKWDWSSIDFRQMTRAQNPTKLGYDFSIDRLISSQQQ